MHASQFREKAMHATRSHAVSAIPGPSTWCRQIVQGFQALRREATSTNAILLVERASARKYAEYGADSEHYNILIIVFGAAWNGRDEAMKMRTVDGVKRFAVSLAALCLLSAHNRSRRAMGLYSQLPSSTLRQLHTLLSAASTTVPPEAN